MCKSVFESRDVQENFVAAPTQEEKKVYVGPQRRRDNRRIASDRRGEVRFDLSSTDRRAALGRRHDDATSNFW
ncbi:MAG: hypothetical protein V7754_20265 [Halioglobus sp.]